VPRKTPLGGACVAKKDNKLLPLGSRTKIAFIDIFVGQIFIIPKSEILDDSRISKPLKLQMTVKKSQIMI